MTKIAVIAGTAFDTHLGAEVLQKKGFKAVEIPLSRNPKEQSIMQQLDKAHITDYVLEKLKPVQDHIGAVFIYCNSLSAALNLPLLQQKLPLPAITPLNAYKAYAKQYQNLLIWAANAQSAAGIEKIMVAENAGLNMLSLSFLPLVEAIEKQQNFAETQRQLQLKSLLASFAQIQIEGLGFDALILGCTHFPYIKQELQEISPLKILDPIDDMLSQLARLMAFD